jgi:hypothetical protein
MGVPEDSVLTRHYAMSTGKRSTTLRLSVKMVEFKALLRIYKSNFKKVINTAVFKHVSPPKYQNKRTLLYHFTTQTTVF